MFVRTSGSLRRKAGQGSHSGPPLTRWRQRCRQDFRLMAFPGSVLFLGRARYVKLRKGLVFVWVEGLLLLYLLRACFVRVYCFHCVQSRLIFYVDDEITESHFAQWPYHQESRVSGPQEQFVLVTHKYSNLPQTLICLLSSLLIHRHSPTCA